MEAGDEELCVGEVRAMVRLAGGDHALVREWELAEEKPYGKSLLDIQLFWPRDPGKSRIRWP